MDNLRVYNRGTFLRFVFNFLSFFEIMSPESTKFQFTGWKRRYILISYMLASAATEMSRGPDGANVFHIIGGDEANNQDHNASTWSDFGEGYRATASNLTHGGDGALLSESFQIPTFGSSSRVVVGNDRSYNHRHCKQYYTEAGCPFGDNCIYIHDKEAKPRESSAIIVGPGSGVGYWSGAATGSGGRPAAPLPRAPLPAQPLSAATTETAMQPLAPLLLAQTVSNSTLKPFNWRTQICSRWERTGYCRYGRECFFAHGEAELRPYGGGTVDRGADFNNQQPTVPNLVAASDSAAAHVVIPSGSSAAHAVGSGEMSGAIQRPIPRWKVPKKINRIYGDWIDDDE
ncbi:hypothetical protein SSX86_022015 [Deinandra increscens subsp. villosa]|uniref:C3H1-type domain-containing protein n=1 Tax=Deinandra increscens subsp. villosa TaxID=3103831 RepID=A0AAP0CME1_9ASTR